MLPLPTFPFKGIWYTFKGGNSANIDIVPFWKRVYYIKKEILSL